MTLRTTYAWALSITLELGLLAVLLGGEMPLWCWLALAVPPLSAILHQRGTALPGIVGTAIAIAGTAAGIATILARGIEAMLLGGGIVLIGILAGRVLTRRTLAHDIQALVLSLLMIFAGTVLHTQISYGVIFILYAIAATLTLVTRQLIRSATEHVDAVALAAILRRRDVATPTFAAVTAALAVAILIATSLLFVFFPRLGFTNLGLFALQGGRFPANVSLQGVPRAAAGGAVMARLRGLPYRHFVRGLYLRGPVYDQLTRNGFMQTDAPTGMPPNLLEMAPALFEGRYEIFMQPVLGPILPTLGATQVARVISGGQANPSLRTYILGTGASGELMANRPLTGPFRYVVQGGIAQQGQFREVPRRPADSRTDAVMAHYLELPEEIDPRIPALAMRVTGTVGTATTADNGDKATALRRYLLDNHDYSLAQPNGAADDPLAAFLFDDPRGHCEYFATAFATLLRASGVPSRVVGGFQGGQWDGEPNADDGVVIFTSGNAHAWVEWYEPGIGWVLDDATPATFATPLVLTGVAALFERFGRAWDDYVVDYSAQDQFRILRRAAEAVDSPWQMIRGRLRWTDLLLLAALGGTGLGLWWVVRRLRSRPTAIPALARVLLRFAERRRGEVVPAAETVREAVEAALPFETDPLVCDLVTGALETYERERFGRPGVSVAAATLHTLRRAGI